MMDQKKKDMSDESLIDQFVERHANDRKDWTSELNEKIESMSNTEVVSEMEAIQNDLLVQNSAVSMHGSDVKTSIDITI